MDPAKQAQLASVLRICVAIALQWVVAKGLINVDAVGPLTNQIVDAVLQLFTLGLIGWGIWGNRKSALIAKVASMGDVKKVIAAPHIADETLADHPKVTTR